MKKLDKNLSDILNIDPIGAAVSNPDLISLEELNEDANNSVVDSDTEFARTNIKELIRKGSDAADNLINVAKESEHPRAYEVFAGMLKTLADMNKDLLELQKRKRDLSPIKTAKSDLNINKAVVFTGTTSDLLKAIRGENQEKEIDENGNVD